MARGTSTAAPGAAPAVALRRGEPWPRRAETSTPGAGLQPVGDGLLRELGRSRERWPLPGVGHRLDGLTHVAAAFYLPDGKGAWATGSFDTATATELITAAHMHGKKASLHRRGLRSVVRGVMQAAPRRS